MQQGHKMLYIIYHTSMSIQNSLNIFMYFYTHFDRYRCRMLLVTSKRERNSEYKKKLDFYDKSFSAFLSTLTFVLVKLIIKGFFLQFIIIIIES